MGTLTVREVQFASKKANPTGAIGAVSNIAKIMEMSEKLMEKRKRADIHLFEDHCVVHGEDKLQEAYEYSFKGSIDEYLADIILTTINLASDIGVDISSAITVRLANKIDQMQNGKTF